MQTQIIAFPLRPRPAHADLAWRAEIAKTLEAADEAALAGRLDERDRLVEAARRQAAA